MEKENKEVRQCIRGLIDNSDSSEDTFSVVFATQTPVLRRDWRNDSYYWEVLSCDPEHVRKIRLDMGLPLFDNHPYDYSAMQQLGKSISYDISNGEAKAVIKWGSRADEALKKDVSEKIVTGISVGYDKYGYITSQKIGDEYPTRTYVDWEPNEISFAPVNADVLSSTRSHTEIEIQNISEVEQPNEKHSIFEVLKNNF